MRLAAGLTVGLGLGFVAGFLVTMTILSQQTYLLGMLLRPGASRRIFSEGVATCERISEAFLIPVLEALLQSFPFVILGFHTDNGSGYINRDVAKLLNKLLIEEQTKSRAFIESASVSLKLPFGLSLSKPRAPFDKLRTNVQVDCSRLK